VRFSFFSRDIMTASDFERASCEYRRATQSLLTTRKSTLAKLRTSDSDLTERGKFTQFVQAESALASVGSAALLIAGGPITAGVFAVGAAAATLTNGHYENKFQQDLADAVKGQLGKDTQAMERWVEAKEDWDEFCEQYRRTHGDAAFHTIATQCLKGKSSAVGDFTKLAIQTYSSYSTVTGGFAVAAGNAAHFQHSGASVMLGLADESVAIGSSLARGGQAANAARGTSQAAAGASTLAISLSAVAAAYSVWVAVGYDPKQSSEFHKAVSNLIPQFERSVRELNKLPSS
jgi:hypothetical protein